MVVPSSLLNLYLYSILFSPGAVVIPLVLEICFVAYENTGTNLGIYKVDRGYIYKNIFIYAYYPDNIEWRLQKVRTYKLH